MKLRHISASVALLFAVSAAAGAQEKKPGGLNKVVHDVGATVTKAGKDTKAETKRASRATGKTAKKAGKDTKAEAKRAGKNTKSTLKKADKDTKAEVKRATKP